MMNRKKLPGIIATILFVVGLLSAFAFLWHASMDNDRRATRNEAAIASLIEQRNSAQNGAAAAVDTAKQANDKLEASGQTPVQIPQQAIEAAQGATGATGATGSTGATGAQGPQGEPGVPGEPGRDGADGATGATGATGKDGATGATGSTGSSGQKGADGQPGAAGADGAAGPAGPAGPQGEPGATGATGAQGNPGEPPVSWTYTDPLGQSYTCSRVPDFSASAPRYSCAADGGGVAPTEPPAMEGSTSDG